MQEILIPLMFIMLVILISVGAFIAWYIHYSIRAKELLHAHQAEWDNIKKKLSPNANVFEEYQKYIFSLPETPFGKGIPRR